MIYDFHSKASVIYHLNFNTVFKQCTPHLFLLCTFLVVLIPGSSPFLFLSLPLLLLIPFTPLLLFVTFPFLPAPPYPHTFSSPAPLRSSRSLLLLIPSLQSSPSFRFMFHPMLLLVALALLLLLINVLPLPFSPHSFSSCVDPCILA